MTDCFNDSVKSIYVFTKSGSSEIVCYNRFDNSKKNEISSAYMNIVRTKSLFFKRLKEFFVKNQEEECLLLMDMSGDPTEIRQYMKDECNKYDMLFENDMVKLKTVGQVCLDNV